jgi:hypothetical protein
VEVTKIERVKADTLFYQELTNNFCRKIRYYSTEKTRVVKDFFRSTFTDILLVNKKTSSKSSEKSSKKNSKRNRYYKHTSDRAATACCRYKLLEYYYLYCFYLFLQKAPKTFKLQEKLKKTVKNTLKKNSNLTEEVKQIQKLIKKKKKKN